MLVTAGASVSAGIPVLFVTVNPPTNDPNCSSVLMTHTSQAPTGLSVRSNVQLILVAESTVTSVAMMSGSPVFASRTCAPVPNPVPVMVRLVAAVVF